MSKRSFSWKFTAIEIFSFKWPTGAICIKLIERSLCCEYCIGKCLWSSFIYLLQYDCLLVLVFYFFSALFLWNTCCFFTGLDEVKLNSNDIDDPYINIDIEKLHSYKIEHLRGWLLYCGDSLRGILTLRDAQLK